MEIQRPQIHTRLAWMTGLKFRTATTVQKKKMRRGNISIWGEWTWSSSLMRTPVGAKQNGPLI